ncbi:MAG: hydrogen peroxide-inducible genes activator [Myxococcales bacterium]|nr:hydrogen peroxide-inducible genes activator [Myxococcales bacterium]
MPSLTQLTYIHAVYRTGHFGKAAAECNVSQPTLSTQIAKAEDELGITIFDRQAKPIVATAPGEAIMTHVREVLAAQERLIAAARGGNEPAGPFTLGIIPTLAPYVLPWFVGPFAARYPRVELTILERPTEAIVDAIATQDMDAAVLATPLGEPTLERSILFYDPFYIYAHQQSPLLAEQHIDLADIEQEDLWLLEDGHCFRNQVVHLCGLHRRQLLANVRFEAGSFETLRGLIDSSRGFTLIPESYARTLPKDVRVAQVRAFSDRTPTREVSLVAHRAQWKRDIVAAIVGELRERAPRSLPREIGEGEILPIFG